MNRNPKKNEDSNRCIDEQTDGMSVCFNEAKEYILNKMSEDLPNYLHYHSVEHTIDVMQSAEFIAQQEEVHSEDLLLLKTAALYHDSGFLISSENHEERSCSLSRRILPKFNYTSKQIHSICNMIMATQIPQEPQSQVEEIICDADLDYLGRDDFWDIAELLYKEFLNLDVVQNEREWNELQVRFFESHDYFTATARSLRREKKQQHLKEIKRILNEEE